MSQVMRKSAFTLIELLVVVIIVAVLAAVGMPLLSANVQRARASEAEAGLGTVRTSLRAYFAENQTYATATLTNIGLNFDLSATSLDDDLDGRWFSDNAYSLPTPGISTYCITVNGASSQAVRNDQVDGSGSAPALVRSMNQDGTIFGLANCAGTALN